MKSRTVYALAVVVVVAATLTEDAAALTAFGKSQPTQDQKPTPKVAKGRACNSQADCTGTPSTSCMLSPADGKKRCLCKDKTSPVNSKCAVQLTEPGKACIEHSDCVRNAECLVANDTRKRTCSCKDGYDWDIAIDDTSCSGSGAFIPCILTLLVTFLVLAVMEPRANRNSS